MTNATITALRYLFLITRIADDSSVGCVQQRADELLAMDDAPALIVATLSPSALNDVCAALARVANLYRRLMEESSEVDVIRVYSRACVTVGGIRTALRAAQITQAEG